MNVVLEDTVQFAVRTLDEDDRKRMHAWFDHLKHWETDPGIRRLAQKLDVKGYGDVYALHTKPDMVIFFRLEEQVITILDLAREATIRMVQQGAERAGS